MKQKTILRGEWKGIYARAYAEKRFEINGVSGIAGLLYMPDAQDFYVRSGHERLTITGKGYSWLQLAPEHQNVWATVMFDEAGRLFQCYFDITLKNTVLEGGASRFDDLYLDVVIKAQDERVYLYDEDELEQAHKTGEIDEGQRQTAYAAREALLRYIERNKQAFFDFCVKTRSELLPELKNI